MKKILFVVFALFISSITILGQTPTGSLSGIVSSPDGVLPNATVEIKFNNTGKSQTATTDGSGGFAFVQLEPGNYTVMISASGFKTFIANDVKIDIGREYGLNRTLEIGAIQESVTVTAGEDVITSTSAQVSNVVSPQQILSLPLITRSPLSLTTLQAGVQSNPFQNTSINGMRTTATNTTRDGISINDPFIRTNATDFAPGRPSVDDTGEFTISTSNQEADLGSGGAQITLVTPRGTSDYHGALFAFNRNSAFGANNFFSNRSGTPLAFRNRNQYGGKIGGPFPTPRFGEGGPAFDRNKGFFFFAYEGIKDPRSTTGTRTILTPSARAGTFTFTRNAAGNPINAGGISCPSGAVGSTCTVGNILTFAQSQGLVGVPSTVDSVIQSRVLSVMPTAGNTTTVGDSLNTTGFQLNRGQDQTLDTYTFRGDVDITQKDSVNLVYSWNREDNLRPDVDVATFTASPNVTQFSENEQVTVAYRRVIASNIVNEFRWGRFKNDVVFDRISDSPSFLLQTPATTSGTLAGGLITNPEDIFQDQGRINRVTTFANNLNWIVGKHSLKFGGQYQKYEVNSFNDAFIIPGYNIGLSGPFTGTLQQTNFANVGGTGSIISTGQLATANSLVALLGGVLNSGTQSFNQADISSPFQAVRQAAPFLNWNHALYASDRWNVMPGLTITGGVRWEMFPPLRLDSGLALEPVISDPDNPAASLLAGNGSFNVVGTNAGKEFRFYNFDKNNFAPSFGIAWSPNFESGIGKFLFGSAGKSVIRGGYSLAYFNDSIITTLNNTLTSGGTGNFGLGRTSSVAIGPNGTTTLNDRASGNLTSVAPPTAGTLPRSFLQNNTNVQGFFGNAGAVDPNLQNPATKQYSVGFQREFFGNTAIEIRYVGTSSDNLTRGLNLNQIEVVNNGFLADFRR
ncbi:MAG: carboxypeptidase regulatory-like domain-containing protein, partial [Blastocatellia bacterium]|nr:carboxypeptidase regulatory-like domain-containing protein [Blastocatellia bacterium]